MLLKIFWFVKMKLVFLLNNNKIKFLPGKKAFFFDIFKNKKVVSLVGGNIL
jgi:hypothetical protein